MPVKQPYRMSATEVYPLTPAGLRSAESYWARVGGWCIQLETAYWVTDDEATAVQLARGLTDDTGLAGWIVRHPDLMAHDPPIMVTAAVVAAMTAQPKTPKTKTTTDSAAAVQLQLLYVDLGPGQIADSAAAWDLQGGGR